MELTNRRGYNEDVLGFTNQTAVLLCGMGAKDLVPQFRDKNISTELLADLTITDLRMLGADAELADRMHKELSAISRRMNRHNITPQQRLNQLFEVLVNSNKHLSLIQAFVTYVRLRISKEPLDSFIEPNNNLRSSKALEIAVTATISEIRDARLALEELTPFVENRNSSRNTKFYLIALSGVGLMTCIIIKKYYLS